MSSSFRFKLSGERSLLLLIVVVFVASRIAFYLSGIYFYHEFVKRMWQSIDVELLRSDLIQSLWYSHAQPPFFNLLTGIVVKVFPQHYGDAFHVLIAGITLLTAIVLYGCLSSLKMPTWLSLAIVFYYMLCPAVVLYENFFSYTPLVVLLITLSVYFLLRFSESSKVSDWSCFWISLCLLALTRSSFHLVWLVLLLGLMILLLKKRILTIGHMTAAIVPISLVFVWYLKNLILFGAFTSSTWMGMNMSRIMPPPTPLGKIGSFRPLKEYSLTHRSEQYPDVKLLHEEFKQNTEYENFFHIDYIGISDQFKKEVTTTIQSNPEQYGKRVFGAFIIYFSPSTHGPFLDKNYKHIHNYAAFMNFDVSGYHKFKKEYFPKRYTLPVLLLYSFILGLILFGWRRQFFTGNEKVLVVFLLATIGYSMVVSNMLEYGENNRFRFEMVTLICILFGMAVRYPQTKALQKLT